jgi:hypothetical protein
MRATPVLGIAWVGLLGCAPPLATLLAEHHHGEALCAAVATGAPAGDADRVRSAFEQELAPSLHLRVLTRAELTRALGAAGGRVHDAYAVLLVTTWLRAPTGMQGTLDARLEGVTTPPTDLVTLARATGEPLPSSRTITTGPDAGERLRAAQRSLGGLAAGLGEVLTLGSVPFMEIFGVVPPRRTSVEPATDAEVRAAAPVASALHEALRAGTDPVRGGHREALLVPRGASGALTLRVTLRWSAWGDRVSCALGVSYALPLGPVTGLDETVRARFGERVVPLRALGVTPAVQGP